MLNRAKHKTKLTQKQGSKHKQVMRNHKGREKKSD